MRVPDTPKTDGVEGAGGFDLVAGRNAQTAGGDCPGAAAQDPRGTACRAGGVDRGTIRVGAVPIRGPLQDVARHVVQREAVVAERLTLARSVLRGGKAEGSRHIGAGPDSLHLEIPIGRCREVGIVVADLVSPRIPPPCRSSTRRVLPFGLGWKPPSDPGAERPGVVPADGDDGIEWLRRVGLPPACARVDAPLVLTMR